MDDNQFDELAGRIEGISQALLRLAAALEMQAIIDGPALSLAWQASVPDRTANTPLRSTARTTLLQMARALDDARSHRQLLGHQ